MGNFRAEIRAIPLWKKPMLSSLKNAAEWNFPPLAVTRRRNQRSETDDENGYGPINYYRT